MPRKSKIIKKDKVILTFEDGSQIRYTPDTYRTYDFVEKMMENILRKKSVKKVTPPPAPSPPLTCMGISSICVE